MRFLLSSSLLFTANAFLRDTAPQICTAGWVDKTTSAFEMNREVVMATLQKHFEPLRMYFERESDEFQHMLNDNGFLEHVSFNQFQEERSISQIWYLSPDDFEKTKQYDANNAGKQKIIDAIRDVYGIEWTYVEYVHLNKPNISMLAYLIYLQTEVGMPLMGGESAQHAICESLGPQSCNTTEFIQHLEETTIKAKKDCGSDTHDIIFVVDSSGSVGSDGFDKIKVFLKHMIDYIWLDDQTTSRIAIIVFSNDASTIWTFGDYVNYVLSKGTLLTTITNTAWMASGTHTEKALEAALEIMINEGRSEAVKTIALFTDGRANDKPAYLNAVDQIKNSGIILNLQSFGFTGSSGSYNIQIDELEYFNQDVHLIDQTTFDDGATFIMRKICSGVLSISDGSNEFCHTFTDDHSQIHLELDMEDYDGFELKADDYISISADFKDPKPVPFFTGIEYKYDGIFPVLYGNWQKYAISEPKIYLTVYNTAWMGDNSMCLRLYKNGVSGRKRRSTESIIEIEEPLGCMINEACTAGSSGESRCMCQGENDRMFPQLCVYDKEYPAQYAVYRRKRMMLIFSSHNLWRNNNHFRSGEVNPAFVSAKRRFFRLAQRALEYLQMDIETSYYSEMAKKRGYGKLDYTPVFQELEESLFEGEDMDICATARNLIYSMKSAVHRYAKNSNRSRNMVYYVEREWSKLTEFPGFDGCSY